MKFSSIVNPRRGLFLPVFLASLCIAVTVATTAFGGDGNVDPDADYDRLDGTGKSGKRVDVIEWEDNLEIHVYPKGSLTGLGLKIDDQTNKGNKVMVISYRLSNDPKHPLIRRAILGIPLKAPFKTFKDPTEQEFDKIVISNNSLAGSLVAFKTDPEPTQLYPDGHPVLIAQKEKEEEEEEKKQQERHRHPAQTLNSPGAPKAPSAPATPEKPTSKDAPVKVDLDDSGTIKPFFME